MRISDWSSDVCSSDLLRDQRAVDPPGDDRAGDERTGGHPAGRDFIGTEGDQHDIGHLLERGEDRTRYRRPALDWIFVGMDFLEQQVTAAEHVDRKSGV